MGGTAPLCRLFVVVVPAALPFLVQGCDGGCPRSSPPFCVLSPEPGARWAVGTTRRIEWQVSPYATVSSANIELSRDYEGSWETLAGPLPADSGSFSWLVTDGGQALPQVDCRIRIVDAADPGRHTTSYWFTIQQKTIWHVDDDAPAGGDGLTWATAFNHPSEAANAAAMGDEVWVAFGTYGPPAPGEGPVLEMPPGVAFYGGFAGNETARADRDPVLLRPTLDGGGTAYHVVTGASESVLDGFIVTGGNATGAYPDNCGGGMYNCGVRDLAVANCRFADNAAGFSGGGMYNGTVEDMTVTDCFFYNNSALLEGGGMHNDYVTGLTLDRCGLSANAAADDGGGMSNWASSVELVNCIVIGNSSERGGGICSNYASSVQATNCTFTVNSASVHGGAVCSLSESSLTAVNCVFWGDTALEELWDDYHSTHTVTYSCVQGGCPGAGNVDADPLFTAAQNVHLLAGSPCIDAADGDSAPPTDWYGASRHDDPALPDTGVGAVTYADMGAREFQGTTPDSVNVFAPAAGAAWGVGRDVTIFWTAAGEAPTVPNVKIELSRDGGTSWEVVAASTVNDRSFTWTVTDGGLPLPQGDCRVKVSDPVDGLPVGTSAPFMIFSGIRYVDSAAAAGGDGFSWATAFRAPEEAMAVASAGHETWVAAGTYTPGDGTDRAASFAMEEGVALYGGFAGTRGSEGDFAARDLVAYETILSGDIGVPGASDDNSYHVVSGASNARLDGFTVTGGNAEGAVPDCHGGGMLNESVAGVTVANCTFEGNSAQYHGGGISNSLSSADVTSCAFTGNSADSGGGMCNDMSSVTIAGCTFTGNSATVYGGGIRNYASSSDVTVTNCVFTVNSAARGGGMCNVSCSALVVSCAFTENSASWIGGGIYNFAADYASLEVTSCTFTGNSAAAGGAIGNRHSCSPVLTNCVLAGNSAQSGGAIYNSEDCSPVLDNCTIVGGRAKYDGGSVYNYGGSAPYLTNCILWGGSAAGEPEIHNGLEGSCTVTYSCIDQPGYAGTDGNISADPLFVLPGYWHDNATPADPADDYWVDGDHHPQAGSPCIDTGDPATTLVEDIEGSARPQGSGFDMGAYER